MKTQKKRDEISKIVISNREDAESFKQSKNINILIKNIVFFSFKYKNLIYKCARTKKKKRKQKKNLKKKFLKKIF
jgi:hypothetical protein